MVHIGRNIYRVRSFIGMDQQTLALRLNVSQQDVSTYELSKDIEEDILIRIAEAIGVTVGFIRAVKGNTTYAYGNLTGYAAEKLADVYEEHIKTKIELYERLVKEKDEKIAELNRAIAVEVRREG